MTILTVSNPVYADANNNSVLCTVTIAGRANPIPYLAVNGSPSSQSLYNDLVAGVHGAIGAYVAVSPSIPDLRAYANAKARTLLAVARTYTLTGGLDVTADATTATGVDLQSLTVWGTANPAATTNWVENDGGVVTLTGAQCVALGQVVLAYAQSVYAALATAMNAIANQTVTTTAAIDALAWPT